MFTLSLHEGLLLVSKVWSTFIFHSQMGLAPSSKVLVDWFKKISSFNPHWLLVSLPMSLGFRVSKFSQNMDGSNIFSIKSITYSWAWVLLLLEKIFEFWSKIYGMLWLMAQCLPPKSVVYTHDLGLSWFDFFFEWAQNLGYIMALWIISSSSFWTFHFKNNFPFLFPFLILFFFQNFFCF